MSAGNCSIQKSVCEKGGLSAILEFMKSHSDSQDFLEWFCGAIATVLSSQETLSEFCTPDVLRAVRECSERHSDNEKIRQFYLGLAREEDARVRDAVARGVCTKEAFPKCSDECKCDEGLYCPKCCVQQRAFMCRTCDKGKDKFYCEVCWKRDHQGHECEEFFCPVRCATKAEMK